jgi:glycosyltransferase involved in cell wall biosynthesis
MRILILTQYFPPEVGAPQNRLFELAVRLKNKGEQVVILTAMPNYPEMKVHDRYKGRFYINEEMDGLAVHRCWIYVGSSRGIFSRLMNYFSFVVSSFCIGLFRIKKQDILICESPPLFLGISAYLLKLFKGAKMVFNVSDLWPESAEKLGIVKNRFLLWISYRLEAFLYRRSVLVSGQTQGIVKSISSRFPGKRTFWLPNGVDPDHYKPVENKDWKLQHGFDEKDVLFLYAGIIGHAQGLEVILKAADRLRSEKHIKFLLLGSGPEKERLLRMKDELKLENVFFIDTVSKAEMPVIIASVDAAVIPLRKLDLFKGAIPSKIFENLAMKKPIVLGVEGEAKELFIDEGRCGLAFEPDNDLDLSEKILTLYRDPSLLRTFGENGIRYVRSKFTRDQIAEKFRNVLNEINPAKE